MLGYCNVCHRVRNLARVEAWLKNMPYGVCTQCEREQDEQRKSRRR